MSHLRPIAPLESEDMPRPDPYAASCNPPRQAKRQRTNASLPPVIAPCVAEQSALPSSPTEDDPAPKRRGRKASASSRAAREAQRKMNHSIIEKARRTKINDALATLRVLVPAQPKRGSEQDEEDEPEDAGKEEKEFKLDVLVRTVTYLQELTERVRELEGAQGQEQGKCASCTGRKRKRANAEDFGEPSSSAGDDCDSQAAKQQPSPAESSTRLPSIASWLPLDPSLMHKPRPTTSQTQLQLPSPPSSTTFRPSVATQLPPAFALPALHAQGTGSLSGQPSPMLSPLTARTSEDESVASLLLAMGASSRRSSSASEHAHAPRKNSVGARPQGEIQPWTPGSMLGLTKT